MRDGDVRNIVCFQVMITSCYGSSMCGSGSREVLQSLLKERPSRTANCQEAGPTVEVNTSGCKQFGLELMASRSVSVGGGALYKGIRN